VLFEADEKRFEHCWLFKSFDVQVMFHRAFLFDGQQCQSFKVASS
jgi:hypothetical protein